MAPALRLHRTPASCQCKFAPGKGAPLLQERVGAFVIAGLWGTSLPHFVKGRCCRPLCGGRACTYIRRACHIVDYQNGISVCTKQYPSASSPNSAQLLPAVSSCPKKQLSKAQCVNAAQEARSCDPCQFAQRGVRLKSSADPFLRPQNGKKIPCRYARPNRI